MDIKNSKGKAQNKNKNNTNYSMTMMGGIMPNRDPRDLSLDKNHSATRNYE